MKIQRFANVAAFAIVCVALVSGALPAEDRQNKSTEELTIVDEPLNRATNGKLALMFYEHVTSQTDGGDLVITSARDIHGKPQTIRMRSGYTRIFRADASRDEFTRQGGWYWRSGDVEGKAKGERGGGLMNVPEGMGPLIRVVYQNDGTVHWYVLNYDFRC